MNSLNNTPFVDQTEIDNIIVSSKATNTIRAYNGDLKYFWGWAKVAFNMSESYPVSKALVQRFILDHAKGLDPKIENELINNNIKARIGKHSITTIERRVAAISYIHSFKGFENPCPNIGRLFSALKKSEKNSGGGTVKKKAILWATLKKMIDTLNQDIIIKRRDKAILLFAFFSGGRRRSEVANAEYKDLTRTKRSYLYQLRKSKFDQHGKGISLAITESKAVTAIDLWLLDGGIKGGYIFRAIRNGKVSDKKITSKTVSLIVKKCIEKIGLNPDEYGAHSLRSGFITEAGLQNRPILEIMKMTGHTNPQTLFGYYNAGNVINNHSVNLKT